MMKDQIRPLASQAEGHSPAQTAGGSGDERNLALEKWRGGSHDESKKLAQFQG